MLDASQKNLLALALHNGNDSPYLTNDPYVNHAVDCHMEDQRVPFDRELYDAEIRAAKSSGMALLGWVTGA